jgi:hypothetical protein
MMALGLTLLLAAKATATTDAQHLVLAVLEEPQCQEDTALAARPLFAKRRSGWIALATEEAFRTVASTKMAWTVISDGQIHGRLTTVDPGPLNGPAWTYTRDHLLNLAPGQTVPASPNSEGDLAGWCAAPNRRPLALLSRSSGRDARGWKAVRPPGELMPELFEAFRLQAGAARDCSSDAEQPRPFSYGRSDVRISKSHEDRSGRRIVTLGLDARRNACDGPRESAWASHTFLVADGIKFLGTGLSLVDAGDYDGDGRAEILFWYSGYNEDGYSLLYDDFAGRVDFRWKYH